MCKFIISFFLSAARWYETVWMTCSLYLLVDLRPLHVLWVASPPGTWAGSGSLSRCCTEKFGSLSLLYNQCPESQQFDILGKLLVYNRQYFSTSTEQALRFLKKYQMETVLKMLLLQWIHNAKEEKLKLNKLMKDLHSRCIHGSMLCFEIKGHLTNKLS